MGYFQNAFSSHGCKECFEGDYADTKGLTECKACGAGTFTNGRGTIACEQCATGQSQTASGTTACLDCDAGKFAGSKGAATCTICGIVASTVKLRTMHKISGDALLMLPIVMFSTEKFVTATHARPSTAARN
jgi:hypothetical protein